MNAILNVMLMVVAVLWFADALCSSGFAYFFKGFVACGLMMKFFDDMS